MTEEVKVIKRFKPFIMGRCRCDCGNDIPIQSKRYKTLRHFAPLHHIIGKMSPNRKERILRGKYWVIYKPDYYCATKQGHVKQHRIVFEEYHKCCLLKWGEIHHIDGKPEAEDGNRIENLQGLMKKQHHVIHHSGRRKDVSDRLCSNPKCENPTKTRINRKGFNVWNKDGKGGYLCTICHDRIRKKNKLSG